MACLFCARFDFPPRGPPIVHKQPSTEVPANCPPPAPVDPSQRVEETMTFLCRMFHISSGIFKTREKIDLNFCPTCEPVFIEVQKIRMHLLDILEDIRGKIQTSEVRIIYGRYSKGREKYRQFRKLVCEGSKKFSENPPVQGRKTPIKAPVTPTKAQRLTTTTELPSEDVEIKREIENELGWDDAIECDGPAGSPFDDMDDPPDPLSVVKPEIESGNSSSSEDEEKITTARQNCRICRHNCTVKPWEPFKLRCHELSKHADQLNYKCNTCDESYFTEDLLMAHVATHEENSAYQCCLCDEMQEFSHRQQLQDHILSVHIPRPKRKLNPIPKEAREFQCDICFKLFKQENVYRGHMEGHAGGIACGICPSILNNKALMLKHHLRCHEFKMLENDKSEECSQCQRKFCSKPVLERHVKYRHSRAIGKDENICDHCDIQYKKDENHWEKCPANSDSKKKKGRIPCRVADCKETFVRKIDVMIHERDSHPELLIHKCDQVDCKKIYTLESFLTTHKRIHQNLEKYSCEVCSAVFRNASALEKHLSVHNGEDEVYPCDICGKTFNKKGKLILHLKIHSEPAFQCDQCPYTATRQYALRNHVKASHPKEDAEKFLCEICGKAFYTVVSKNAHVRGTHERDRSKDEQICDVCGITVRSLKEHYRRKHAKVKNVKCYFCQKMFHNTFELGCHLTIHTLEKPYKCETCEKDFTQKHVLVAHRKKCPGNQNNQASSSSRVQNIQQRTEEEFQHFDFQLLLQ